MGISKEQARHKQRALSVISSLDMINHGGWDEMRCILQVDVDVSASSIFFKGIVSVVLQVT